MADGTIDPGKELAGLINELAFTGRKAYGMHGQIHWMVTDVTRQTITVQVWTPHPYPDPEKEVLGIRDGILGYTDNLVPCPRFRALFSNPRLGLEVEYEFPFIEVLEGGFLRTRLMHNQLAIAPRRRQMRPRFEQAWRALQGGSPQENEGSA
jgi:hypothetical protein